MIDYAHSTSEFDGKNWHVILWFGPQGSDWADDGISYVKVRGTVDIDGRVLRGKLTEVTHSIRELVL